MSTGFEPYVSDPAEPPLRRRMAGREPAIWTLIILILIIAATTLFWVGRGEEDPGMTVPASREDA